MPLAFAAVVSLPAPFLFVDFQNQWLNGALYSAKVIEAPKRNRAAFG
jgi:hypothetical protein